MSIKIPTEPVGSIPRPRELIDAIARAGNGNSPSLEPLYEAATRDTIAKFEATGSPVITDGEQRKYHNFWTYSVDGLPNCSPDGFRIPFAAGHERRMPHAQREDRSGMRGTPTLSRDRVCDSRDVPVKQAVISPSALSLMYPPEGIPDYPREKFIDDLIGEHVKEVRRCLQAGAHSVQIDFTEGRLALKIDPTGELLSSFIDLNNLALAALSEAERRRVGVHTCPGGDRDSTHSADVSVCAICYRACSRST